MKNCENCAHYINGLCWREINNLDPSLIDLERDSRKPDDTCDEWEYNELSDN